MKRIQLLLVTVLFVMVANAQLFNIGSVGIGYFYAGPKLGMNGSFNTVEATMGNEKTANYGYQFGGVAKLGLTDKLSVQPELIFTSKGYKENSTSMDASSQANTKYFGLPVIVKYAFVAIKDVQIYGSGGFYTDYMTGIETIYKMDGEVEFEEEVTDFSPYNRVDFGFSVGGGSNINLKNNDKLNIDLRLTFGTIDVEKQGSSSSSKNISVQLSAIYLLDMTRWISFGGAKKTESNDAYEQNSAPIGGSKVD